MIDTQGFILITLAVVAVTLCIMFAWLCSVTKQLENIQSLIHKMEDVLWEMQSLLSVQDVDAARLPEDGHPRLLTQKPTGFRTGYAKAVSDDSIRKTPNGS